jgi:sulfonate transport system substrate-binding protein
MLGLKIGGVPEHFNLPWRLAIEENLFEQCGIELHWSDMTGGTGQMIKGLQMGSIDIAVLLTEGITKSILEGLPACIMNIYVNSPLRWGVHVPAHSNYQSLAELENKTFAISRFGSGSHLMALVHADQAGWNGSNLKFNVVGDIYGGLWALENSEADGFLWEKFTTHPFVEQGKCRCIGEVVTPWPCFVIAVRHDILENNQAKLNELCRIVGKRALKLKTDPQSSNKLAWRYHLNIDQVKDWLKETEWNYDMNFNENSFQHVVDVVTNLGLLNKADSINWKDKLFTK